MLETVALNHAVEPTYEVDLTQSIYARILVELEWEVVKAFNSNLGWNSCTLGY